MLLNFLFCALGVFIGFMLAVKGIANAHDGDLYLDDSDPDFATAGIHFNRSAEEIAKRKCVYIMVVHTRK